MNLRNKSGELILFDGEHEKELHEFSNIYFNVKNMFASKEVDLPFHERNLCKVFREKYDLEFSTEEMLEIRDYYDNYYAEDVAEKLREDQRQGMTVIDLKKLGLE